MTVGEFYFQALKRLRKNKMRKKGMTENVVFNNQVAKDEGMED